MTEMALVLLPGLDGSGVLFGPLLGPLQPELRPIVLTYPPDRTLGYDELLPLVLAALPSSTPFVLLGESFSGPLALMAAATRPSGLRAVVLCASFVRNPLWLRASWLRYFARPIAFRLFPEFLRAKALLGGYSTPELRALTSKALANVTPQVLAHRVRATMRVDVSRQLRSCPVPILYLRGESDFVVLSHNLKEILKAHPSVQANSIPAPHMVLQTQPVLAAAAISEFVGNILPWE